VLIFIFVANDVYFKDVWSELFQNHLSERSFFTPASGTKRPCMMMNHAAKMLCTEFEVAQVVVLPYCKG